MIKKDHHDFLKSNIPTIFENKRKEQTSQEIIQKKLHMEFFILQSQELKNVLKFFGVPKQ